MRKALCRVPGLRAAQGQGRPRPLEDAWTPAAGRRARGGDQWPAGPSARRPLCAVLQGEASCRFGVSANDLILLLLYFSPRERC